MKTLVPATLAATLTLSVAFVGFSSPTLAAGGPSLATGGTTSDSSLDLKSAHLSGMVAGVESAGVKPSSLGSQIDSFLAFMNQYAYVRSAAGQQALMDIANDPVLLGLSDTVFLDFDEADQPCGFLDTAPLKGIYLNQALLEAPNADGGAILNDHSNFGFNAFSGDNFLAFNSIGGYPDGASAGLPHVLAFRPGHTQITLQLARCTCAKGGMVTLVAFGPHGIEDTVTLAPAAAWTEITMSGDNIAGFIIMGSTSALVIDDVRVQ